jgi:putative Mn2+ efflux pump MntP
VANVVRAVALIRALLLADTARGQLERLREKTVGLLELFLTGVGLSMDAFAVAICKGLSMKRVDYRASLIIALFFGGFQALMPLIGWAAGIQFASYITSIDHWIAFALLAFIGGKMLWDAFHEDDGEDSGEFKLDYRELLTLAIATSIDALAVGITFAFLQVDIVVACSIIGVTTFVLSFAGVSVGNAFGSRFERPSTIAGGIVLILIGVKILLEHLGIISF